MQVAAEAEPDAERRAGLKQALHFLGSAGKDLFVNILASVIAQGTGLA
jgi:hypothetical protein